MKVRLGVVAMALVIATGASPLPERTPAQITKQERDVLDMVRDRLARFMHTWRPGWGPCRDPQMQEAADVATVTLRADTSTAFMAEFAGSALDVADTYVREGCLADARALYRAVADRLGGPGPTFTPLPAHAALYNRAVNGLDYVGGLSTKQ